MIGFVGFGGSVFGGKGGGLERNVCRRRVVKGGKDGRVWMSKEDVTESKEDQVRFFEAEGSS